MSRLVLALAAVGGLAATAGAQPGNLPLAPGVHPASPIGPGTQFLPQPRPQLNPAYGGNLYRAVPRYGTKVKGGFGPVAPFGFNPGAGFGFGFGGYPYYDYGYGYGAGPTVVVEVNPPAPPAPPQRTVVLANEFPATLTVQFPAPADVWLDGQPVAGDAAEERVLTSPVLRPGARHAFNLKARWTLGGKTYEAARTVTLAAGDRSRLIVVSGTEVK